jgi:hypothetical protein
LSQSGRRLSRHEELSERLESGPDATDGRRAPHVVRDGERELLRTASGVGEQPLLRTLQGQALVVEQRLDAEDQVEIAAAIQPLARRVLLGSEQLELRLPVPEDVRGDSRRRLGLADPVVELVR